MTEPGVIVVGIDTPIGLTILRELGTHGVPTYGIANAPDALGLHSRWLTRGFLRPDTDEKLVELLNAVAVEHPARLVMAISEPDILLLNRHAASLGRLKLLIPDARRMALVLDKRATYEIAAKVGINVPRMWQVVVLPLTP